MNWMPAFLGSGWRPAFSSRVQLLRQSTYDFLHPCHSLHPSHPYLHLTESPCAAILEAWRTGGSRAPGLLSFGSRAKSKDEGWAYPKAHCLLQHLGSLSPARLQWHQLQAPPPPRNPLVIDSLGEDPLAKANSAKLSSDEADCNLLVQHDNKGDIAPSP
jgi:hypothetical protein